MDLIQTSSGGGVATVTLNRPEARNALSIELCDALVTVLGNVDRAADVRAVVLRGAGPVFCAGADFAAVSGPGGLEFLPAFERMLEALARFRLPTIAAIHGAALGGGLQLAVACDFRLATRSAKLGIPSSKLGILVNFENVQRLVLLAGIATAKEVLMRGDTMTGDRARELGLVNATVGDDALDAEVAGLASDLASRAPLSVQGTKRAIQVVVDHLSAARNTDPAAVAGIDDLVAQAYRSEDLAEGLRAMAEKRPPNFESH